MREDNTFENLKEELQQNEFIKELFGDDEEFLEAFKDAQLMEQLKTPTIYSVELEDIENKLKKLLKTKKYLVNDILFANYKRLLYKHILEVEKMKR